MNLIPANEEKTKEFEKKMSKDILYRSTDNFITIYNNNLINVNNDKINEIAKEITYMYKNIYIINQKFVIKSEEEVISEEFLILFPHIAFIAKLKRIAENVMSENYPEDTLFVFTEDNKDIIHLFDPVNGKVAPYEGAEKISKLNEQIANNPLLQSKVNIDSFKENGISFKVMDMLKIDTSFITQIGELLNKYINRLK